MTDKERIALLKRQIKSIKRKRGAIKAKLSECEELLLEAQHYLQIIDDPQTKDLIKQIAQHLLED